ncbi:MAG: carbohydrate ABC transporter permease [bacterium]
MPRKNRLWLHVVLIAVSIVFLTPFYCMVATSLKGEAQIQDIATIKRILVPDPVRWANYAEVGQYIPVGLYFRNTIYVTLMSVVGTVFSCSLVAFGFSRLKWPGRDLVFLFVMSTMMLPVQVTLVPLFIIFGKLGWVNSFKPLWVPTFFGAAFFIFLLRQFFLTLPRDLEEAAKIDGCGYFRIFWEVMLPLIKPALAAVILFQFLWAWNDFQGPLVYLHDRSLLTLSLGLQAFRHIHNAQWALMLAAATMMTAPVIVVFFAAQRYFLEGITLTGLKA